METFTIEDADDGDVQKTSTTARGNWSSQLDYVVSVLGSIVGYGNLWRFPYLCNRNGGGAFLIPFVFFIVTCGLPLFFLEISIGQFAARSNTHIWGVCPIFKGIGIGQFVACTITIIYYQTIIAWSIYYLVMSCASVLPWTTCDNTWNTESCLEEARGNITFNNTHLHDGATRQLLNTSTKQLFNRSGSQLFHTNTSSSTEGDSQFTFAHTDVEEFW